MPLILEVRCPRRAARHAAGLTQRAPAGPGSALGQGIVAQLAACNTATDALRAAVGEVTGELKGLRADVRLVMTTLGNFNEQLQGRVAQLEKENAALREARGAGAGKENAGEEDWLNYEPATAVTAKTKKVTPASPSWWPWGASADRPAKMLRR